MVPVSVNVGMLASSVIAPMTSVPARVMVGPSLLPLTVIVTVSVTLPPWPSLSVTVNFSTAD